MAKLDISFPEDLSRWIESRVVQGGYDAPADYVRAVVQHDRDYREQRERLLAAIDEGLASPIVDTTIEDIIAERRGAQAAE
ncbi:type II toxin-antitoxin system ParD family antitoxin [uncultured Sphingomonas sp.]|uniref:ribbon-helix-helix domain-containing protein n=1 Tax=uncultured Sphingomonas sp. TaxID=158754 RepID=UPI0035C96479